MTRTSPLLSTCGTEKRRNSIKYDGTTITTDCLAAPDTEHSVVQLDFNDPRVSTSQLKRLCDCTLRLLVTAHSFCPFKVVLGQWLLHKSKANMISYCDLGFILHRFRYIAPRSWKSLRLSLTRQSRDSSNFAVKFTALKVKTFRYFQVIRASSVSWQHSRHRRQTDDIMTWQ